MRRVARPAARPIARCAAILSVILALAPAISAWAEEAGGEGASSVLDAPEFAAFRSSQRIIGGEAVDPAEKGWRFTGSLEFGGEHWCGGTYLVPTIGGEAVEMWREHTYRNRFPRLFLTAAHCLYDLDGLRINEEDLLVVGGDVDRDKDKAVVQPVAKAIAHPDYNRANDHDIALLILGPAEGGEGVVISPLQLPDFAAGLRYHRPNAALHVYGWGVTSEGGRDVPALRTVRLPYAVQADCRTAYRRVGSRVSDSAFCAGFSTGEADSCQGDSGGPMVFRANNGRGRATGRSWLVGLVSYGRGCARYGLQGVYTDVLQARWWIEEMTLRHRKLIEAN